MIREWRVNRKAKKRRKEAERGKQRTKENKKVMT